MKDFYKADPGIKKISDEKIKRTFKELAAHPDMGEILVLENEREIVGYIILINFWTNEWGGNILYLDEIYVKTEFRNQGIGSALVNYLIKKKYNKAKAIVLEISPANKRAEALYRKLGFQSYRNKLLIYDF